jgi:hypothetical protein
VYLLKKWELIEGRTIGVDSFKVRAQNSLKNNYNEKKIAHHLEHIDQKITEYEQALEQGDKEEEKAELAAKIAHQKTKQKEYEHLHQTLQSSGEEQISRTDPDARAVVLHRNIVNVGYNIQASTDSKHKLLLAFDTGEVNDTRALSGITLQTKALLELDKLDVLADKGYHTGQQIKLCADNNITTYVSPKAPSTKDTGLYPISLFTYNHATDTYTCPSGATLHSNGTWHHHSSEHGQSPFKFKRYTTTQCKTCTHNKQCTTSKRQTRAIDRSEYANAIEANNTRVTQNPNYYRERQQITEHIFGTLKRQRGFTYTLVRTKEKVLGEVALMFIGYNLSRSVNILGITQFFKTLRDSVLYVFRVKNEAFSNEIYAHNFRAEQIAA